MKRIDERRFCGARAGAEIVNSAVMTIATETSQCFQGLPGQKKESPRGISALQPANALMNLATAYAEECNRKGRENNK
jgi:hypothetical protein